MKVEAYLFSGTAAFFAITTSVYLGYAQDPAGACVLGLSALMSALVAAFLWAQHRRHGPRPSDRRGVAVREVAGNTEFFPARSGYPILTAAGVTLMALGVVYGLWLFLLASGVLAAGVAGFAFESRSVTGSSTRSR